MFWEEPITYFTWYNTDHIENDALNLLLFSRDFYRTVT
jgi:hypothetical protein